MYRFYSAAKRCYVHLEDLQPDDYSKKGLSSCRWLTRGWTLQELLAPRKPENVRFYDRTWKYRGTKLTLAPFLSDCTGIRKGVLLGSIALANCSIAERMSWAAGRQTTRIEDIGYSLLGLFEINMPLLYGEGTKSFRRLQEEIVKRENDLTILAWESLKSEGESIIRLFAESPAAFSNSSLIDYFHDDFGNFSITNKGLLVSGEIPLRVVSTKTPDGKDICMYALFVGTSFKDKHEPDGGIYLRKLGPKLFTRELTLPLAGFGDDQVKVIHTLEDVPDFYILTDPRQNISKVSFWKSSLHIPSNDLFEIEDTVPEELWDVTNRVFLKPNPYIWMQYPTVIAMELCLKLPGGNKYLVVFCDYRGDYKGQTKKTHPSCKVFWKGEQPREEALIFRSGIRNESIYWSQLEIDSPHILQLSSKVTTRVNKTKFHIWVCFAKGIVASITDREELFSLKIDIRQQLQTDESVAQPSEGEPGTVIDPIAPDTGDNICQDWVHVPRL
ncbi:Vegetative incompatibility HET-E-1 [Hyphodiscus hymeniophilus]|uniref:Vegetative incompatibility HET-E-1 n=1 Tax=Hyphodiscus hymeniophilus TaxID=353542 RepID=A0A9P7AWM9_9HELO|nr:Vegetative incompatibility HET-E-1 [Hyphodiscus hymeniophilus]